MSTENIVERVGHGKSTILKIKNFTDDGSGEELFPKMDERGKIIGVVSRSDAHRDNRNIHAGVGVFILDKNRDRIFLPKRSQKKDADKGCLDFSTGEHLTIDPPDPKDPTRVKSKIGQLELWRQAAQRGLREEIKNYKDGVEVSLEPSDYTLIRLIPGQILDRTPKQTELRSFYVAILFEDLSLTPNPEEFDINGGGWFKISDLFEMVDGCPKANNPLLQDSAGIRPMLLSDLKRPEVRRALQNILDKSA